MNQQKSFVANIIFMVGKYKWFTQQLHVFDIVGTEKTQLRIFKYERDDEAGWDYLLDWTISFHVRGSFQVGESNLAISNSFVVWETCKNSASNKLWTVVGTGNTIKAW